MTAADVTTRGQVAAEELMVDTCTIIRSGGERTFDRSSGNYIEPPPTTVYTGKCRVKPSNLSANRTVEAGEEQVSLWPFTVSVPIAETGIDLNDLVIVTASVDPSLVDRAFRVRSVARGTFLTARRLDCEESGDAPSINPTDYGTGY